MEPVSLTRVFLQFAIVVGLAAFCAVRNVPRYRLMLIGIALLSGYGMLQDQVSARLCPEYFTKLHPPIPGLTEGDPTLLGIAWGFLGAWGGGAILGYAVGIAAAVGPRPPLGVGDLVRPMLAPVAAVAASTALTGIVVWVHTGMFGVRVCPELNGIVSPERHRAALTVACYHFAAYATAIVGSVALCVWVSLERKRRGTS